MLEKGGGERGKQPTDDCSIKKGTSGWREAKEKGTRERAKQREGGGTRENEKGRHLRIVWNRLLEACGQNTLRHRIQRFSHHLLTGNRTNTHVHAHMRRLG